MPIWLALLVAPILALMDQAVAYATVGWACAHGQPVAVHAVHVLFLAIAAACTWPAMQLWNTTRARGKSPATVADRHFLAGVATASGLLAVLVILSMWMPTWVIAPCVD